MWLRSFALAAAWLLLSLVTPTMPTALADAPEDAPTGFQREGRPLALPPAPEGYTEVRVDGVRWSYPTAFAEPVEALISALPEHWARINEALQSRSEADFDVRIVRNVDELRRLAPQEIPPPDYAVGVAYPHAGIILVSLSPTVVGAPYDVESTLAHELSHVALHRAVRGRPVPRWFSEGLAATQSGEYAFRRAAALYQARGEGRLVPLADLDGRFHRPRDPRNTSAAYAQAADMVAFLENQPDGAAGFRRVVLALRRGETMEEALLAGYGLTLQTFEAEWNENLAARHKALPLVLAGLVAWIGFIVLIAAAYRKRRGEHYRGMDRMGREEARARALALAEQRTLEAALERAGVRVVVIGEPGSEEQYASMRAARDALALTQVTNPHDLPTIDADGEQHTLH